MMKKPVLNFFAAMGETILGKKPSKILIAGADQGMAQPMVDTLQTVGYDAFTAGKDEDIVQQMQHLKPDLTILDVGDEPTASRVLTAIQDNPHLIGTPMLLLTRSPSADVPPGLGNADLLSTSLTPDALVTKVSEMLERNRRRKGYAWEKFHAAVHILTLGKGDVRERLVGAYSSELTLIRPENLPAEIRDEFAELSKEMTKEQPSGDEGSIQATVNRMSEDDASRCIKKILSMYDTIARHQEPF